VGWTFVATLIRACFFQSIWTACPTPTENNEINSAALIESRVKLLDIKASLVNGIHFLRRCLSAIDVPTETNGAPAS
jgi:hypothetical protein